MIGSRKVKYAGAVLILLALALCAVMVWFPDLLPIARSDAATQKEYEHGLFGTGTLLEIEILMAEEDWQDLLDNPTDKTEYPCDVVIDGVTYANAAIQTKGNTSLSQIASDPTTDRYSLKIKFDYYEDQNLCQGLDELVLNSNYADATYLKEYFSYQMFAQLDAAASLTAFANVSVNGENRGLYLAIEGVDESFAQRNFGADHGQLYKPDTMEMGGDGGQMGGAAGGGADLIYTDADLSSYSAIWDSAVFTPTEEEEERVVQALQHICQGEELETYLDVDAMLRYLAAHTFTVNLDSLSGTMTHNYFLYEQDGRLSLIPWDYNLAFGGFQSSDATDVVNFPIDTPVSGVSLEDRPIFACLLEVEEYREQYHAYLRQLAEHYLSFEEEYQTIRQLIDQAVADDPTAFYTYEEYDQAADLLYQTITLRAQSILGQLDSSVPSTTEAQQQSPELLVDASAIDLSQMGSMNLGGGGGMDVPAGGRSDEPGTQAAPAADGALPSAGQPPDDQNAQAEPTAFLSPVEDSQSQDNAGTPAQDSPAAFSSGMPEGSQPPESDGAGDTTDGAGGDTSTDGADTDAAADSAGEAAMPTLPQGERQGGFPADFGGQRPDGESPPGEEDGGSAYSLWLYLGCFTLLAAAFVPVLLCQRRRRFRP